MDSSSAGNFVCKICFEPFSRDQRHPISLNCGHTFCICCVKQLGRNGSSIFCGLCRRNTYFDYRLLGKNVTLIDLLEFANLLAEDGPGEVSDVEPSAPWQGPNRFISSSQLTVFLDRLADLRANVRQFLSSTQWNHFDEQLDGIRSTFSSIENKLREAGDLFTDARDRAIKRTLAASYLFCIVLIEILPQLHFHPSGCDEQISFIISNAFKQISYRDPSFFGNNYDNSLLLAELFAEVIGVLSQSHSRLIQKTFLDHLNEYRKEALTNQVSEFEMGVSFLNELGSYFLEVDLKQKDLKHALAGLLVEILLPMAAQIKTETNIPALISFVDKLYGPTYDLVNKKQHKMFLNLTLANLKNKDSMVSRMALESLYRLIWVYIIRISCEGNTATRSRLESICGSLFPRGSRNLVPRDAPLNIFVKIIHFIAQFKVDFAFKEIIFDLIGCTRASRQLAIYPERMNVGLRALMVIADGLQQKESPPGMPHSLAPNTSGTILRTKRNYITKPLSVDVARSIGLEQYYPHCRKAFDAILRTLDGQIGRPLMLTSPHMRGKEYNDIVGADMKAKLDLFRTCIAAVPRLLPDPMSHQDLIDFLTRMCIHVDEELRSTAYQSLQNLITECPEWREDIIHNFIRFFISSIQDTFPTLIESMVRLLLQLLSVWKANIMLEQQRKKLEDNTGDQTTNIGEHCSSASESIAQTSSSTADKSAPGHQKLMMQAAANIIATSSSSVGNTTSSCSEGSPQMIRSIISSLSFAENVNPAFVLHCVEGLCITLLCQLRLQTKKVVIQLLREVKQLLELFKPTNHETAVIDILDSATPYVLDKYVVHISATEKNKWPKDFAAVCERLSTLETDANLVNVDNGNEYMQWDAWACALSGYCERKFLFTQCSTASSFAWPILFLRFSHCNQFVDPSNPQNESRSSLLRSSKSKSSSFVLCGEMLSQENYLSLWQKMDSSEVNRSLISSVKLTRASTNFVHLLQKATTMFVIRWEATDVRDSVALGIGSINPECFEWDEMFRGLFEHCAILERNSGTLPQSMLELFDSIRFHIENDNDRDLLVLTSLRLHFAKLISLIVTKTPIEQREKLLPADSKRSLFFLFLSWCSRTIGTMEKRKGVDVGIYVEQQAIRAMCALTSLGPMFECSNRICDEDSMFRWLETLLSSANPIVDEICDQTLCLMLHLNEHHPRCFEVVFEHCAILERNSGTLPQSMLELFDSIRFHIENDNDRDLLVLTSLRLHFAKLISLIVTKTPIEQREKLLPADSKRSLFFLFLSWCSRTIGTMEKRKGVDVGIYVEQQAIRAMCALTSLGPMFECSNRICDEDSMFRWLETLLSSANPIVDEICDQTLCLMLHLNEHHPRLLERVVQMCYTKNDLVGIRCFRAISMLFSQREFPCEYISLLCLCQSFASSIELASVRQTAFLLVQLLRHQFLNNTFSPTSLTPIKEISSNSANGQSEISFPSNQLAISKYLSSQYPQLTMPIFSEICCRLESARPNRQLSLLTILPEWLRNVHLVDPNCDIVSEMNVETDDDFDNSLSGDGEQSVALNGWGSEESTQLILNNLLYLTAKLANEYNSEVENIWQCVATSWPSNLAIIVHYLFVMLSLSLDNMLALAKRICVYLLNATGDRLVSLLMGQLQRVGDPFMAQLCRSEIPPFFRWQSNILMPKDGTADEAEKCAEDGTANYQNSDKNVVTGTPTATFVSGNRLQQQQNRVPNQLPMPPYGGNYCRLSTFLPSPAQNVSTLSRNNLALFLLCDLLLVGPGNGVDWSCYHPKLLHMATINLDAHRTIVCVHARQILLNLCLYFTSNGSCSVTQMASAILKHCHSSSCNGQIITGEQQHNSANNAMTTPTRPNNAKKLNLDEESRIFPDVPMVFASKKEVLTALVQLFSSDQQTSLWEHEEVTQLCWKPNSVKKLECLVHLLVAYLHSSISDLVLKWTHFAIDFAISSNNRHLAGRSFQTASALGLSPTPFLHRILSRLTEVVGDNSEESQSYITDLFMCLQSLAQNMANASRPTNASQFQSPTILSGHSRSVSYTQQISTQQFISPPQKVAQKKSSDMRHSLLIGTELLFPTQSDARPLIRSQSATTLKLSEDNANVLLTENESETISQLLFIGVAMMESNLDNEYFLGLSFVDKLLLISGKERLHCLRKLDEFIVLHGWDDFPGIVTLCLKGALYSSGSEWAISVFCNCIPQLNERVVVSKQPNDAFALMVIASLPQFVLNFDAPTQLCSNLAQKISLFCQTRITADGLDVSSGDHPICNLVTIMNQFRARTFPRERAQWTKCVVNYLIDAFEPDPLQLILFLAEMLEKCSATFHATLLDTLYLLFAYGNYNDSSPALNSVKSSLKLMIISNNGSAAAVEGNRTNSMMHNQQFDYCSQQTVLLCKSLHRLSFQLLLMLEKLLEMVQFVLQSTNSQDYDMTPAVISLQRDLLTHQAAFALDELCSADGSALSQSHSADNTIRSLSSLCAGVGGAFADLRQSRDTLVLHITNKQFKNAFNKLTALRSHYCNSASGQFGCCEQTNVDVLLLHFCRSHLSLRMWALVGPLEQLRCWCTQFKEANVQLGILVRNIMLAEQSTTNDGRQQQLMMEQNAEEDGGGRKKSSTDQNIYG
uniref:RING-type domain-containing protein n=1 Tax=Globodera pallida TaxID=36090 RepID=A0A183BXC8_GLOPA